MSQFTSATQPLRLVDLPTDTLYQLERIWLTQFPRPTPTPEMLGSEHGRYELAMQTAKASTIDDIRAAISSQSNSKPLPRFD